MSTLTHTAAFPVMPTRGPSLLERLRTAGRALAAQPRTADGGHVGFGGGKGRRQAPKVVYMRFWA